MAQLFPDPCSPIMMQFTLFVTFCPIRIDFPFNDITFHVLHYGLQDLEIEGSV